MPTNIKIMFWNVENFGVTASRLRLPFAHRCDFLAQAIVNADADVFCLIELRWGWDGRLQALQAALDNASPAYWYYDVVPAALSNVAVPPYNTNADVGYTKHARHEAYAVFWRQNLAKFVMQRADPIDPALVGGMGPMVANTQSFGVHGRTLGPGGAIVHGFLLAADIVVPAAPPAGAYILPAGTIGIAPGPVAAGTLLPAGTVIGGAGVQLNLNPAPAANPIVIPGGYTLTTNLTLPVAGTVLVPQHVLSLVLTGRQQVAGGGALGNFANFNPLAAVHNWDLLNFPDGIGTVYPDPRLERRPAFCTIKANVAGGPANQLIPITMYHAPLQAMGGSRGMRRSAYSRSMYQAFDHTPAVPGGPPQGYINNNRAVLGGDFNKRLDANAGHYRAFTDGFGAPPPGVNGGANCRHVAVGGAVTQNIRANEAFPAAGLPPPVYPVLPAVPSAANNPVNKSSIALRHRVNGGNPVLSNNSDHYRRSPVDNALYRGFTPAETPLHAFRAIYDLMRAITGGAAPVGAPNFHIPSGIIQAFDALGIFHPAGPGGPAVAPAAIAGVLNPGTLLQDIQFGGFGHAFMLPPLPLIHLPFAVPVAGGWMVPSTVGNPVAGGGPFAGPPPPAIPVLTPERRAAEFLRLIVSDHLPVIFEMNI